MESLFKPCPEDLMQHVDVTTDPSRENQPSLFAA